MMLVPIIAVLLSYFVYGIIWRLYFSPIAKFPGPKLAAISILYEIYHEIVLGGNYTFKIKELHERYGPIIRINPWELHINDPDYYDELYVAGGKRRDKYPYYTKQFGNSESMIGTVSHNHHRLRRGAMNRYFSKASVFRLEPMIQKYVDSLVRRLCSYKDTKKPVNLSWAFSCFTFDVISEYALGRTDSSIKTSDDFHTDFHDAIENFGNISHVTKVFPWIFTLMQYMPLSLIRFLDPKTVSVVEFQMGMKAQIGAIINGKNTNHERSSQLTIFHEILSSDLPPNEKSVARLWQEGQTVIGAGTETTAWTLSVIAYHVLANPDILSKLLTEMEGKNGLKDLEQLPYLTSVIQEGLRLSFGVVAHLQRISPDQVLKFHEWEIPSGTPVSMSSYLQHLDHRIFPSPNTFSPDRFLENPSLSKYIVSFSKGSRQCLGINLAWAELYLCVKGVIGELNCGDENLALHDTNGGDVECTSDYFVPASSGRGVRVLVG
ncbi:hypothetical protein BPOR_0748g00020 [Botrytis porri]|uniref:Cytochrome P450 n=1 Tax=Botrytis porri TaxID=87229 RepID=A0A4Z1KH23_9HELO|nr:hypothetical protein BPOR_0748g00020 [Botrytis porri]